MRRRGRVRREALAPLPRHLRVLGSAANIPECGAGSTNDASIAETSAAVSRGGPTPQLFGI